MNGWMKAALLSIRHFHLPFVVRHLLLGVTRFCQPFFWLVQQFGAVAIKQIASELHFKYFGTVFSLLPSLSRSLLPLTLPYLMLANTLGVQSLSTVRSLQSASTSSNSHLEQSVHCSTFTFEPQRQSERAREWQSERGGARDKWIFRRLMIKWFAVRAVSKPKIYNFHSWFHCIFRRCSRSRSWA